MKKIVLVAFIVYSATQVNAQEKRSILQLNTITTAVPFLLIAPDSRHGALGDAGVASSPDANSMHWNAAKMVFNEKEMGISISYSPWLRELVKDINLSYVGFYKKLGKNDDQAIGASLRYFSLGDIKFTNEVGDPIGDFNPAEWAFDLGYSRKLGDRFSMALSGRYIYSNLTGGIDVAGQNTKAGTSFAADVSAFYTNPEANLFGEDVIFNLGLNISNIGSKMSYTESKTFRDFIPTNLRLGPSIAFDIDQYNSLSFMIDLNKMLVPTPNDSGVPDVGLVSGMFQSFGDAPGGFKEELHEIMYSFGAEYWYNKQFALRGGYLYENKYKGNRKYFTLGAGLKYNIFGLDFAYLIPVETHNPLENTLRFSLLIDFEGVNKQVKK